MVSRADLRPALKLGGGRASCECECEHSQGLKSCLCALCPFHEMGEAPPLGLTGAPTLVFNVTPV